MTFAQRYVESGLVCLRYQINTGQVTPLPVVPLAKTTTYQVTVDDRTIFGDATGAAFTITLPTAASCPGQQFIIKKIDASANAVTVKGSGSELVDAANTLALASQYSGVILESNGTQFYIVGNI